MTNRFLKPAEGRTVDQLDGRPWPAEGMFAEDILFVRRRLEDGDLVEVDPPGEAEPTQAETDDNNSPAPKGGRKPTGDK